MRLLRQQFAVILLLGFAALALAPAAKAQLTDLYVALGAGNGHPSGGVDIFKTDGTHVSTLVADGSGGIFDPTQPLFGPDGRLYVPGFFNSAVKVYDGTTGAYIKDVGSGLSGPLGLAFDASGFLYASSASTNSIEKIDVSTGAVVHTYFGFSSPNGLLFSPTGDLLVANSGGGDILSLDTTTGATSVFATGPSGSLAYGPDGRIYIDANTQIDVVAATGGTATKFATVTDFQGAQGIIYADGAFFVSVDDGFRGFDATTGADIGFHPTGDHNTQRLTVRHPLGPPAPTGVPEPDSLALLTGLVAPAAVFAWKQRKSRG